MKKQTLLKFSLAGCVIGLFAGCASTQVTSQSEYEGFLPKPRQVLVHNFAVSPEEVTLDSGITADIQGLVDKAPPRTDQERVIGRQVADALANHLVTEIQALGLPASRATGTPPADGNNTLQIKGQFVSIDEGNQTERVVIGLGLGRTDVKTLTQVYDHRNGTNILVNQFGINAKSGDKPGAAETMGAGAVAGHLVVSAVVSSGVAVGSEAFSANVDADADRTAKKIAAQLKDLFLTEGWIPLQ
ncbi:MAG: DUF4410 domain-containing protein [Verrucomicrobiia bacterium]